MVALYTCRGVLVLPVCTPRVPWHSCSPAVVLLISHVVYTPWMSCHSCSTAEVLSTSHVELVTRLMRLAGACCCSALGLLLNACCSCDFTAGVRPFFAITLLACLAAAIIPTAVDLVPYAFSASRPVPALQGPCGAPVPAITPMVRIADDYVRAMLIRSTTPLVCIILRTVPALPVSYGATVSTITPLVCLDAYGNRSLHVRTTLRCLVDSSGAAVLPITWYTAGACHRCLRSERLILSHDIFVSRGQCRRRRFSWRCQFLGAVGLLRRCYLCVRRALNFRATLRV